MMIVRHAPTLLATLVLFAACGKAGGPSGPHGGENTFDVILAGEEQDFDEIGLVLSSTSTSDLILSVTGSVDPLENAIDDEYSLQLEVRLDRALIAGLTFPATLSAAGTTRVPAGDFSLGVLDTAFEPEANTS